MAYDLLFLVTDREGFRVSHPQRCASSEMVHVARRLLSSIQAVTIEVWLGEDRVFTCDNASSPAFSA